MKRKRISQADGAGADSQPSPKSARKSTRAKQFIIKSKKNDTEDVQASHELQEEAIVLGATPIPKPTRTPKGKGKAVVPPDGVESSRRGSARASKQQGSEPTLDHDSDASLDEEEEEASLPSSDELNGDNKISKSSDDVREGRPKGRRGRSRTPTPPPRMLPPHEQYFFQNRPGGTKTSDNTFSSVSLLSHEKYYDVMKNYKDPHRREIEFLHDLHSDSFDQWMFELEEGFSICLYGWGSKRRVVMDLAEHVAHNDESVKIVVMNGFAQGVGVRDLFEALASVVPDLKDVRVPANPTDALDVVTSALTNSARENTDTRYLILIHSMDAPSLRRPSVPATLARLASHPAISLMATCDTSNFPILWDASLRTQFNWVFHDTTTFAAFDTEISGAPAMTDDSDELAYGAGGGVVDVVNSLLGRSGRKVHGREGVVFVLRSLTESARRLYGLLAAEVLSADELAEVQDGQELEDDFEQATDSTPSKRKAKNEVAQNTVASSSGVNIEYRSLYRKAVQSLIATSEMQFRQLLKEFYDHEMLASKKDSMGTELLSLPFRRDELESILEEIEVES